MGCLNVDDKWFDDPRRDSLIELIGQTAADGTAMKMWRLAETWFRKESRIPRDIFFAHKHAKEFLQVKLAEERPDGVYIKGSNEFFQYIQDAKESKRRGGLARAESSNRDESGRFSSTHPADASSDQLEPGSLSSSSSSSSSFSSAVTVPKAEPDNDDGGERISLFSDPDVREFLSDVSLKVQRIWVGTYGGKDAVEAEIKKAIVQWEAGSKDNPDYQGDHPIPLYLNRWFNRPKKAPPKEVPRESAGEIKPKATPEQKRPCVLAGYLPGTKQAMCKTHSLAEACQMRDSWKPDTPQPPSEGELKPRNMGALFGAMGVAK